jgi:hypothetical protein
MRRAAIHEVRYSGALLGISLLANPPRLIGPKPRKVAVCREFGDCSGDPRARLCMWIAGVYRGVGPQNHLVDQRSRARDGRAALLVA